MEHQTAQYLSLQNVYGVEDLTVNHNLTVGNELTVAGIIITPGGGGSSTITTALEITTTTQSNDTTTGALVVAGGVGIAKNLNVGGYIDTNVNYLMNGTGILTKPDVTSVYIDTTGAPAVTSFENVCIGSGAGSNMVTSCFDNVLIGYESGISLNSANNNVLVGTNSTFGYTLGSGAVQNVLIGNRLDTSIANASNRIGIGYNFTVADNNSCQIGNSLVTKLNLGNITAIDIPNATSLFVGTSGLGTTGVSNVCVGLSSGAATTSGQSNTFIGAGAAQSHTTSNFNVSVGAGSGSGLSTGGQNTLLGCSSAITSGGSNQCAIGFSATCTANLQTMIGNSNMTSTVPNAAALNNLGTRTNPWNQLNLKSYIELADQTAPVNPSAGQGRLYKKTGNDGIFWLPDAAGVEVDLTDNGNTAFSLPDQFQNGYVEADVSTYLTALQADPITVAITPTYVTPSLSLINNSKKGSIYDPINNRIYFLPSNASSTWHYYDCYSEQIIAYTGVTSGFLYLGGAYDPFNNRIYLAPAVATVAAGSWHYINCASATVVTYTHGLATNEVVNSGYDGAVYHPVLNRIYFVPYNQAAEATWHYIDCSTGSVVGYTAGTGGVVGGYKGGSYDPILERIYFVPYFQAVVTTWHYISSAGAATDYTHGSGITGSTYTGSIYSPIEGRIYFAPYGAGVDATWKYITCSTGVVTAWTHGGTAVSSAYSGGAYFPTCNRIYFSPASQGGQTNWHYIDCATGTLVSYTHDGLTGGAFSNDGASYNPIRDTIVFGVSNNTTQLHMIRGNGSILANRSLMANSMFNQSY